MAVRLVTDAARLAFKGQIAGAQFGRTGSAGRTQAPVSGNFMMQVIYDGTTNINADFPALPANELWVDGSGLVRVGNNFGPTFQNIGGCTCVIYGCQAPRDYAYKITAARVSELSSKWNQLASLSAGEVWQSSGLAYSVLRFVFTQNGSAAGAVEALAF